jgi:hypothetical protein
MSLAALMSAVFSLFIDSSFSKRKTFIHKVTGLQRIMAFSLCPFGMVAGAFYNPGLETLLTTVDTFTAKRVACYSVLLV